MIIPAMLAEICSLDIAWNYIHLCSSYTQSSSPHKGLL